MYDERYIRASERLLTDERQAHHRAEREFIVFLQLANFSSLFYS